MPTGLLSLSVLFCSLALYFLLAGQMSWSELGAGLPVAIAIAAFAIVQHNGQQRRFQLRAPWRHVLVTPLIALVTDSVKVGAVLAQAIARRPQGAVGDAAPQPFRPGGEQPIDAGRRAVVTLGSSLAPNGFVMDVAPSLLLGAEEEVIMHRLVPGMPNLDMEWPV